jgi:pimeloyl-ACP methyl ester carboxylesterase
VAPGRARSPASPPRCPGTRPCWCPPIPASTAAPRPDGFDTVADLASGYLDLLDALGLTDVLVIGSSVGGWIAAEMALRDTRARLRALTLIDAAGVAGAPGREVADVSVLSPAALSELSFHRPELRPDFGALSTEQKAAMAANQRALAVYAGDPYMHDPKLAGRLHRIGVPVLALWGEHDGVTPLEYGREFARLIPGAAFVPVAGAAHFPFVENPEVVFAALEAFLADPRQAAPSAPEPSASA